MSWNMLMSADTIADWLHHLPTDEHGEMEEKKNEDQNSIKARLLNFVNQILPSAAAEIIERCKQARTRLSKIIKI